MHLQEVFVTGFRNLIDQSLALSPGFNLIVGENGAGKTAFLEALYSLARGRSFRTTKTTSVIHSEADSFLVRGDLVGAGQSTSIGLRKSRDGTTEIRIGGESSNRMSALAEKLPVNVVLPTSSELVFGGPARRRDLLDWGLFHVKHDYLASASAFARLLRQRNAWLKTQQPTSPDADPWLGQLLDLAESINSAREWYVAELQNAVSPVLESLGFDESIRLEYGIDTDSLRKKVLESWARDVKSGTTNYGPHRADMKVGCAGGLAADILSRGQGKLVASALQITQSVLLEQHVNRKALLLVDDFGAELDAERFQAFSEVLAGLECQVVGTSVKGMGENRLMDAQSRVFHVKQGVITLPE